MCILTGGLHGEPRRLLQGAESSPCKTHVQPISPRRQGYSSRKPSQIAPTSFSTGGCNNHCLCLQAPSPSPPPGPAKPGLNCADPRFTIQEWDSQSRNEDLLTRQQPPSQALPWRKAQPERWSDTRPVHNRQNPTTRENKETTQIKAIGKTERKREGRNWSSHLTSRGWWKYFETRQRGLLHNMVSILNVPGSFAFKRLTLLMWTSPQQEQNR